MNAPRILRALGAAAVLLSLATTARADTPPPQDRFPGRDSKLPTLDQTFGVDSLSSQPGTGLAMSPQKLDEYVKSVEALNVSVAFHTDKGKSTSIGDTSHWKKGPLGIPLPRLNPGIEVRGDSDIRLSASYSKKDGQDTATLDHIQLQAPAVHFGPFGLLSVQNAEIKSNGEINVKLSKYLPTMTVRKITREDDGSVHLDIKWAPDVYITPDGDVQIKIGPSFLQYTQTIGHIDVNLFAEWPPSLKDFIGLVAAPAAAQSGGMVGAFVPDKKSIINSLAGTASFNLHAETKDTPIEYDGSTAKASGTLDIHGDARVENGHLTTIGDKNTANLKLRVGGADINTKNGGAKIDGAELNLGGKYHLDLPLAEPSKSVSIDFDGKASVSAKGKDAYLNLPSGAKIQVGGFDGSANVGVKFSKGPNGTTFSLQDGDYSIGANGPIHVEKLGKISSLDADGEVHSKGTIKIGPDGLAQLTGDLKGKAELQSDLPIDFNGGKTTIKKGSTIDLALDQFAAAVMVPRAAGKSGKPTFVNASASGDVGVHGAVGPTTYSKNGVTVNAPGASVDATFHGGVNVKPGSYDANGHVTGGAKLEGPASVNVNAKDGSKLSTTLGTGSNLSFDGDVSAKNGAVSANGSAKAHADVGKTTFTKNGLTVNAPSGTLDLGVNGSVGPSGTKGKFDADVKVGSGTKVDYTGGPMGSSFGTTLAAGSHLGVSGDLAGNSVKGTVKGQVNASGFNGSLGPATVHLPADAKIGVTAPFDATAGSGGVKLNSGSATVPIRIDLHKGTKVAVTYKGVSGTITLDTEGSYVDLVAKADIVNGKPVIRSLDNVKIELVLGDVAAAALGQQAGLPINKRLSFQGDASFRSNGLDLKGTASFGNKGSGKSFFQLTW